MQSKSSTGGSGATAPRSEPGKSGNLRTRFLSALVLGPPVLVAVYLGGWVFFAVVLAAAVVAVREWVRLVEPHRPAAPEILSIAAVAAVLACGQIWGAAVALAAVLLFTGALYVSTRRLGGSHRRLVAFGIPYLALGSFALLWLRAVPEAGLALLLYLLFVVWASDIGAYGAGRAIGGPKLAPRISPKKTWAGLIGGAVCAAGIGYAVALAFGARLPGLAAAMGGVLAVVGQAGDLFESAIKRRYNVKDSSHLIPGHGGLLDRIDALVAAAPVFALFHAAIGTRWAWW